MKIESFFEYTGEGDEGYVVGNEYPIAVIMRSGLERFVGIFFGIPFSWKIVVLKPIAITYNSLDEFSSDWKFKFTRFNDESI